MTLNLLSRYDDLQSYAELIQRGGKEKIEIKLKALMSSMALAMTLAQPVTAMSADLVEYYDNGY